MDILFEIDDFIDRIFGLAQYDKKSIRMWKIINYCKGIEQKIGFSYFEPYNNRTRLKPLTYRLCKKCSCETNGKHYCDLCGTRNYISESETKEGLLNKGVLEKELTILEIFDKYTKESYTRYQKESVNLNKIENLILELKLNK